MSCKTCCFFHEEKSNEISECRRRAPSVLRNPEDVDLLDSFWPDVEPDDWCGEYVPSEACLDKFTMQTEGLTSGGKLTPEQSEKFVHHAIGFVKELEERLVEELADYAHEAWSGWMKWMLPRLFDENMSPRGISYKRDELGTTTFQWCDAAQNCLDRWKRQMETPYSLLSQKEKESDRKEARRMLEIIRKHADVSLGARKAEEMRETIPLEKLGIHLDRDWNQILLTAEHPQAQIDRLAKAILNLCSERITEGKSACDIAVEVIKEYYC